MLLERSELQRLRDGDPGLRGREAGPDPGSVARLADVNLQLRGAERGFRLRRRWLTTALEGLSWEAKTRVAGHFSVGRGKGETHDCQKQKSLQYTNRPPEGAKDHDLSSTQTEKPRMF